MPKRTDIHRIMILGAGPIIIGQACEFDYSGTQACKALKEEGFEVILANSNPATIMTDPGFADRTYVEPLTPEFVERIIERERPDALLPTLGGQTALNLAIAMHERGVLAKYGVEVIGASIDAIHRAEDRERFKQIMEEIGLVVPASGFARTIDEAMALADKIGLPLIIRPSFTLGGTGGNVAYNIEEYREYAAWGLKASPVSQILVEQSVLGWKEYELEVMRDHADNVVIICSIENFDPMGVHTGDSITVAPAQTLTDKEYQLMRDAAIRIIRAIGVDTGGSNIQFGIDPANGDMVVIEMNPRVSRSSALASKATGFPIAKIAAKLAVGYTLDEIPNDITRETPASFEPTIDYVVTKIPRFTFEKFPQADARLTTQMKSVGEAMSIGRTQKESLQKALTSMEIGSYGFESRFKMDHERRVLDADERARLLDKLRVPNWERIWYVGDAFRAGLGVEEIHGLTKIDPWFLHQIREIVGHEADLVAAGAGVDVEALRRAKEMGFSDRRLARLLGVREDEVRRRRLDAGVRTVFKRVDTCGAEFEAHTPYLYSTYEEEDESAPTDRRKIVILGGGPNRIGQGIEFDYCCVHAAFALKEAGFETIMVNCNPETVSTDYDTSDRLYFEPLTLEHVLGILEREKPYGVIVQFGGQTPLKLAVALERAGAPIIGTSPDAIDRAEDRERFRDMLIKLDLRQPPSGIARSHEEAVRIAEALTYPVLVRPSYVLGGRAMEIVYDQKSLDRYMTHAVEASEDHPVLVDKFLSDAIEVDVDAISDGETVVIGGVMEHIERAGVHSGDSACSLPPRSLPAATVEEICRQTKRMARELGVVGLMNVQFAVQAGEIFILEVNPRASRTVPFVSKAVGVPLAKYAARVMAGEKLAAIGFTREIVPEHVSVKESVFPFIKFPGVDVILGPEMRSTGEVMGIDRDFGAAFAKSQLAAGTNLPRAGTVFLSIGDPDKSAILPAARRLAELGFQLLATTGTRRFLVDQGLACEHVPKVHEGRPHVVDRMLNGDVHMVINTVVDTRSMQDSFSIRRTALNQGIPYFTTSASALAAAEAIATLVTRPLEVKTLQEFHAAKA